MLYAYSYQYVQMANHLFHFFGGGGGGGGGGGLEILSANKILGNDC